MKRSSPPRRNSRKPTLWTWLRRLLVMGVLLLVVGVLTAGGVYLYFDRGLPSVEALRQYRPPQVSKVTCADGEVCAEFYRERRTLVPIASLPSHVKNAFLAAEDADFYKHEGLDFIGLTRGVLKGLKPGARMGGGSTISQQVCKNLLLTSERKLARKIREMILTPRIEEALTKEQILELYVNQIYFGHNRYGIEEASLFYFGKHARELSVGEAAVLAGTVQLPHRINPLTNAVKAKKRQRYVLTQLARHGFLPEAVIEAEIDKPILLSPRSPPKSGASYAEEIRRTLLARYGEAAVLEGGLRVKIAMNPRLQAAAEKAVQEGLEAVDRRKGYRGAVGAISPERFERLRPHLETVVEEAGRRPKEGEWLVDLAPLTALVDVASGGESKPRPEPEPAGAAKTRKGKFTGAEVAVELNEDDARAEAAIDPDDLDPLDPPGSGDLELARKARLVALSQGATLAGIVTSVDDGAKKATIDFVSRTGELAFQTVTWARRSGGKGKSPKKISDVVAAGDVVRVRILSTPQNAKSPIEVTLHQVPEVQGALAVIDPTNRHVVALVGGYDFTRSSFNRATQARRQPGSTFKPFLYGAALATGQFTSLSKVNDAPEVIRDKWTGKPWRPQNYEKGGFEGPMTLRAALTHSKNTVSVRLLEAVGPPTVIDFARRAGIQSPLPDNLTLALGTGEVQLLELTNAYATLHSQGRRAEPLLLLEVKDSRGRTLEEHVAAFEETLQPEVAFLTTSLMRSVVEEGTARAVLDLHRPAAGKTGTANEYRDAWFAGFTADYVAASWVGYDNHDSLGFGETGGRAALPAWLSFMKVAHEGLPERDFDVPPGVAFVRIDPLTGQLAGSAVPGRLEPFLEGTEPTTEAAGPDQVAPEDFFLEDRRGGL